jgi:hypothetical protein
MFLFSSHVQQLPWSLTNSSHCALARAMSLAVPFPIGMCLDSVQLSSDARRVVNDAILVSCSLRYENVFGFGKVLREFAVNV